MLLLTQAAFALSGPLHAHRASCNSVRIRGIASSEPPGRPASAPSLTPLDAAAKKRARKARWRKGAKERQETALTELTDRITPPFGRATLEDAYSDELTEALRRHCVDWEAVPAAAHPRRAASRLARRPTPADGRTLTCGDNSDQSDDQADDRVTRRGLYKRLQVQSFAAALQALQQALQLPIGATVLDCGSGQGNLALPLAALAPTLNFVGVEIESGLVRG